MQTKVLHWVHWSLLWDGVSSQFVPSCLLDRSLLSAVCWKQNLPTDSLIKEEEDWPERYILSSCYFSIPLWQYAIVISSDVLTVFHPGVWEVGGLLRNLTTLGYFQSLFTSFTLGIVLKNGFSSFCPDHGGVQLSAQRPVWKHHQRRLGTAQVGLQGGHPRGPEQQHHLLQGVVQLPGEERQAGPRWDLSFRVCRLFFWTKAVNNAFRADNLSYIEHIFEISRRPDLLTRVIEYRTTVLKISEDDEIDTKLTRIPSAKKYKGNTLDQTCRSTVRCIYQYQGIFDLKAVLMCQTQSSSAL